MEQSRGFRPRAIGEIALRCRNLDTMTAFYTEVLGLAPVPRQAQDGIRFFKIADGVAGHTTVLALFQAGPEEALETGADSSLHHLALSLPRAEQEAAMRWYDRIGQPYRVQVFGWIGWRGVFTQDPEGNTVELVAYDAAFKDT